MPLKTDPDAADLAALLIANNQTADEGATIDVGDTSGPVGAAAPTYQVNYASAGAQFTASLVVTAAAVQGNNTSIYLQQGVYETNLSLSVADMQKDIQSGDFLRVANYLSEYRSNRVNRVYLYMPADIADLNRRAEREHCQDFIYAYQQTLAVFEAALRNAAPVTAASQNGARDTLFANVIAGLPRGQGRFGVDLGQWFTEFERLCEQTRVRDQEGWHSFGLETVDAAAVPGSNNPVYLTGNLRDAATVPRVFLKFNTGSSEIGAHTSAQVIV